MATQEIVTLEKIEDSEESGTVKREGICVRSPNGQLWQIDINDLGEMTIQQVSG